MGLMNWIQKTWGASHQAASAPAPVQPEDWQALGEAVAQALAPDQNDSLAAEVQQALIYPSDYFSRFTQDLEARGIQSPQGVNAWLALVDGLQSRELCVELDWKFDMEELVWALQQLRFTQESDLQLEALAASETTGNGALTEAAVHLRNHGLALIYFDMDSDSYPLALLPSAHLLQVQELAKRVGEKIHAL